MTKSGAARKNTPASDIIYPASLLAEDRMGSGSTPKPPAEGQKQASTISATIKQQWHLILFYVTIATAMLLSMLYGSALQRKGPEEVSKSDISAFIKDVIAPEVNQIKKLAWANEEALLELQQDGLSEAYIDEALESKFKALGEVFSSKRRSSSADLDELEKAVKQLRTRMSHLSTLQANVADVYEDLERKAEAVSNSARPSDSVEESSSVEDAVDLAEARRLVHEALEEIRADEVGLSDYALGTLGAKVERRFGLTSSSYVAESESTTVMDRIREFFFFPSPKPAEAAIHGDNSIGNCWACKLPNCNLTVALLRPISPAAVTLDHISPNIAYNIESAPRDFRVFGVELSGGEAEEMFLGTYSYNLDQGRTQTFAVENVEDRVFTHVKLQVVSNHGHEEYTCLYRFRVHEERA